MTARREAAKVEFYDLFELGRSSKRIIKIRFLHFYSQSMKYTFSSPIPQFDHIWNSRIFCDKFRQNSVFIINMLCKKNCIFFNVL